MNPIYFKKNDSELARERLRNYRAHYTRNREKAAQEHIIASDLHQTVYVLRNHITVE